MKWKNNITKCCHIKKDGDKCKLQAEKGEYLCEYHRYDLRAFMRNPIFALLSFVIIVLMRFTGVPDQYANIFNFYNAQDQYPTDIYMNNSFFFDGSVYFTLNKFLRLVY